MLTSFDKCDVSAVDSKPPSTYILELVDTEDFEEADVVLCLLEHGHML